MKAFYHADPTGIPINPNVYSAYLGFLERGYELVPFTTEQMIEGKVAVERDTPVTGGILTVKHAWRQLDVAVPATLDYPDALRPFLGRSVERLTQQEVMERLDSTGDYPLFIKPADEGKLFTGLVVKHATDSAKLASLAPDTSLFVSSIVNFISEWRVFVLDNEILDARSYKGDPLRAPDRSTIETMIAAWASNADNPPPVAYSLDAGIVETSSGECHTYLVEVNDSYSLGAYGLHPLKYSRMIAARWAQVVGGVRPTWI